MVKFYSLSISLSHNICLGDEENQARKHDEYKLILQFAPAEFTLPMPPEFPVKATRAGASKNLNKRHVKAGRMNASNHSASLSFSSRA